MEAGAGPSRRTVATVFATALGVLVVCVLVVRSGEVSQLEKDAFHAVNDLPDLLEPVMWVFQLAGLVLVPVLVLVGACVRTGKPAGMGLEDMSSTALRLFLTGARPAADR